MIEIELVRIIAHGAIQDATALLNNAAMLSSAQLCLDEAIGLYDAGDHRGAALHAARSLAYSVGIGHPAYLAAISVAPRAAAKPARRVCSNTP